MVKQQSILRNIRSSKNNDFDHYVNQIYMNYKERGHFETRKEYASRNNLSESELKSIIDYARKEYGVDSKRTIVQQNYEVLQDFLPAYSLENILVKDNIIQFQQSNTYSMPTNEKYTFFGERFGKLIKTTVLSGLAALVGLQVAAKDIFSIKSAKKEATYVERIVNSHGTKIKIPIETKTPVSTNTSYQIKPSTPEKRIDKTPEFPQTPIMPPVELTKTNYSAPVTVTIKQVVVEKIIPAQKVSEPRIARKQLERNTLVTSNGTKIKYENGNIVETFNEKVIPRKNYLSSNGKISYLDSSGKIITVKR